MKQEPERTMDEERFRALIEAYGADSARWPCDERTAALALLERSHEAGLWLAEQARLDALLDGTAGLEVSATLQRRIAEIPIRGEREDTRRGLDARAELSAWWPFLRLRNLLVAGFAAGALGVVAGVVQDRPATADAQATWDDLSDIALAGDLSEELSP